MTSAPPRAALAVVPPEICKNCTSPAISAFMPSTPVGVAMTSTSKPCLAKMPFSRATQGGNITADSEVKAMRSLRKLEDSAAWLRGAAATPTISATLMRAPKRDLMLLPAVKSFGILPEHFVFCLLGNVLAAADGRGHVGKDAIPMGIVRSEHDLVVADTVDHVGKRFFFRLHGEEPIAAMLDVFARLVFA